MLKIKDLNVSISNKQILKDFNLELNEGEIHVIMGTNGIGKSTLAKTLSDHYDCKVHSGQIEFKGKNLLELDPSQRANEGIFMSFQNPVEVQGVNNMYFLKTAVNEKRAYQNQEEVNSAQFLKEVKDIIKEYNLSDEIIKRNVNEGFSGGEKKKNEMLQLLVLKPDLIILDEIDSGLDIDAIKLVAKAVKSMLDGKRSVLMITHYDRLLELIKPHFVHILKDGKIIKSGDYNLALEVQKNGFEAVGS